jgi:hypothetical protein
VSTRHRPTVQQAYPQLFEVTRRLAQPGAGFVDVAFQQVGNRHARVGRLVLAADHHDFVAGRGLAQGLDRHHAGRAIAQDQMFHG